MAGRPPMGVPPGSNVAAVGVTDTVQTDAELERAEDVIQFATGINRMRNDVNVQGILNKASAHHIEPWYDQTIATIGVNAAATVASDHLIREVQSEPNTGFKAVMQVSLYYVGVAANIQTPAPQDARVLSTAILRFNRQKGLPIDWSIADLQNADRFMDEEGGVTLDNINIQAPKNSLSTEAMFPFGYLVPTDTWSLELVGTETTIAILANTRILVVLRGLRLIAD